jgi:MFS family permease
VIGLAVNHEVSGTPREAQPENLWRHTDFLKVWSAFTLSLFGSEITALALPLIAVTLLGAGEWQMGLLSAAGQLPFILLSLFVGVWVDRVNRKRLLLVTDYLRAFLLLLIPLVYWLGELRLELLYLVTFGVGALSVIFELAHYAYVPALLEQQRLVNANSKLQVSYSAASASGPGLAGFLLQIFAAPLAVFIDAATYVVSGLLLSSIKTVEPPPVKAQGSSLIKSIREGMTFLLGHRWLRPIVLTGMVTEFFARGMAALFILFASRDLGFNAFTIGFIFASGGVSAVLIAPFAGRIARFVGVGPTIIVGYFLSNLVLLLIPLASGAGAPWLLAFVQVFAGAAGTLANIHQWSLRQSVTPSHLLGRVTASHRFLVYGSPVLGALIGGGLAAAFGLRTTLFVFAVGASVSSLWMAFSPLRHLRDQP